uniref:Regulating synaptic membrane exocytosis protein 2 n=1 Tax=Haemonchus contortus TaxID=6289 RepID=A0A7I4Z060_HAECO
FMGCTQSKKSSKISSDKTVPRKYSTSASSKPKSVEFSHSTISSVSSERQERQEEDNKVATKSNMIVPLTKHHLTSKPNENPNDDGNVERHRSVDSVDRFAPNPNPREAAKEAARAVSRETPYEEPKEIRESRDGRNERRRKEERRRSRQRPQPINTFWDQEDQDYIARKNMQRNQRRIHAMQDRNEADDTLYEVPVRMPEVDFTTQSTTVP